MRVLRFRDMPIFVCRFRNFANSFHDVKFALTLKHCRHWHSLISFAMIPDLLHTLSLHERRAEALALHCLKGENRKLWLPCVRSEFRFFTCLLLGDHKNFCRRVETLAYVKGPLSAWHSFDHKPGRAKMQLIRSTSVHSP